MSIHLSQSATTQSDPVRVSNRPEFTSSSDESSRPELYDRFTSTSSTNTPKPGSATKNEQGFVPASMRALYYSYAPILDSEAQKDASDRPDGTRPSVGGRHSVGGYGIPDDGENEDAQKTENIFPNLVLDMGFPTPVPSSNEYLLKIQTAAFCQDELRLAAALNPPVTTPQIPLHSICGTVINTPTEDHEKPMGPRYKIGDVVFGVMSYARDGGAADYAVATEGELALKPPNITAAEAAAVALPALTAWQALFKYGGLDPDGPANLYSEGQTRKVSIGERIRNSISSGMGNGNGNKHWNGNGAHQFKGNGRIFGNAHDTQQNGGRRGSRWLNGNGHGVFRYGVGNGNGHGWWNRRFSWGRHANGNGGNGTSNGHEAPDGVGKEESQEQGNETVAEQDERARHNTNGTAQRKAPQLRVLVTNARDSEVGRLAVQILRAERLFNHVARPWICVTCTAAEAELIRREWDVDEVVIIPHLPAQNECDLGRIFRRKRFSPVDLVLDCTGDEVFRQAHSEFVIKEYGAVLTAVDARPAQEPFNADVQDFLGRRKRGIRSRFVPVNPDSMALARIAEFIEDNMVRGREEQVVDLVNAAGLLEAGGAAAAGSRRGAMMVVRVN